jgi:acyl phosphate:glycerol-3-phosphate acyltransferase
MTVFANPVAIVIGYLIGAIPSAYILGRLWAGVDLRQEGDGHISATAMYRHKGRLAMAAVIVMDMGKGILAVYLASLLTNSQIFIILAAYATVIGHCWSVYLDFKGGLGGVVTFGVLASLAFKEVLIGIGFFLIILLFTRKSSWGTYVYLIVTSLVLFIEKEPVMLSLFPAGLLGIHLLKRYQTKKLHPVDTYKNEVFDDLKRQK